MTNEPTKNITIVVSPKGRTKVETHGYFGPSCREASKFIEEALGKTTVERLKPTFYQENFNQQTEYETQ